MYLAIEAGPDTIDVAVRCRVRGVPVDGRTLVEDGEASALGSLRRAGLTPCQIGVHGYNPLHPDPAERRFWARIVVQAIPLARRLGVNDVVISAGNHQADQYGAADPRNRSPEALIEVAQQLRPLVDQAEAAGVRLAIEPYLKSAVSTPDAFIALAFLVGSPSLRCVVDCANWYGFAELLDPAPLVRRAVSVLAGRYGPIHVKEIALLPGFHLHAGLVPLGAGRTDWGGFLARVARHAEADTWVLIEHAANAAEAEAAITHLRSVAATAGVELA
jgi:sugar phosphate isomerase/epimerase